MSTPAEFKQLLLLSPQLDKYPELFNLKIFLDQYEIYVRDFIQTHPIPPIPIPAGNNQAQQNAFNIAMIAWAQYPKPLPITRCITPTIRKYLIENIAILKEDRTSIAFPTAQRRSRQISSQVPSLIF